jgi:hypothetical protein
LGPFFERYSRRGVLGSGPAGRGRATGEALLGEALDGRFCVRRRGDSLSIFVREGPLPGAVSQQSPFVYDVRRQIKGIQDSRLAADV